MKEYIEAFVKRVETQKLKVEGIAVHSQGKTVYERRWYQDVPRNIYSHTKSFMSTAVGIAISDGKLSTEDRLADFFPEAVPDGADPRLKKIKLRHLLTMSSGFGKALLMGVDRRAGVGVPDYVSYMLSQPIVEEPGERFCYSTADSILAGRMIEKAVSKNLAEYLYERLFKHIGIGLPIWECCPQGHPIGGGGMYLRLDDMMKLGVLYLNEGRWDGTQLVDPAWIGEAVKKQIDTHGANIWECGYGYQFWLSPYPAAYRADGMYGQITTVLPESGTVVSVQCPEDGDFDKVRLALHEELLGRL